MRDATIERLQHRKVEKRGHIDRKLDQPLYLACEDLDFSFSFAEVETVKKAWDRGMRIQDIAVAVDRADAEVLCLLIDFSVKGFIEPRARGLF